MPQFNEDADRRLEALERQLAEAVAEKEAAQTKYDTLFTQVFHEFDAEVGEDMPAQYIASDKFKLARLVPDMQPVINNELLQKLINDKYDYDTGRKIWQRITVATRVVLQNKLAQEMKRDPELGEAIALAGNIITTPVRKPSRIRKEATAKEIQAAAILSAVGEGEEAAG